MAVQEPNERVAFEDMLEYYQTRVKDLDQQLAIASGQIKNRDKTIEELRSQIGA